MAQTRKLPRLTRRQQQLVERNVGLAGHVVYRQFKPKWSHAVLDADDLMQESAVGLCVAATKFDPARGKFSTLGPIWSRQAVSRYVERARLIRIPSYRIQQIRDAERANGLEYTGPDALVWRPVVLPIHVDDDDGDCVQIAAEDGDPLEERREAAARVHRLLTGLRPSPTSGV